MGFKFERKINYCFTGHNLRPVNLKKKSQAFYNMFIELLDEYKAIDK